MPDEIPVTLAGGSICFPWPERRVREYCSLEAYRGYDDFHSVDCVVSPRDIDASRRLHPDKVRFGNESQFVVNSRGIQRALGRVPDAEIDVLSDDEWAGLREACGTLLGEFTAIPGVGLAKAGKVLHLKRPHLFPAMDSFVIELLTGAPTAPKGKQVELGLKTMDTVRADIRANAPAYFTLQQRLADLPIPLTRVRMHDILCWSYWKWDRLRNLLTVRWEPSGLSIKQVKGKAKETLLSPPETPRKEPPVPITRHPEEITPDGVNVFKIETLEDFDRIFNEGEGYIVITDKASGTKLHRVTCVHLKRANFVEKVIGSKEKYGSYYWCRAIEHGKALGAQACVVCLPPR